MTSKQFHDAFDIAMSDTDLENVDMSLLLGFALTTFKPVVVTLEAVAKCIRWQAKQANGQVNAEALLECYHFFVWPSRRVTVV